MQKILRILAVSMFVISCSAEENNKLDFILSSGSRNFKSTLQNPTHEIQIIYGEIVGDSIIHHTYGVNEKAFFYPASTVKMPVAFAALKRAEEHNISIDDALVIDSTEIYPRNVHFDSLFQDSLRLRNLITKIFTVSDNAAYNYLYGWLGKDYINELYNGFGMQTRIQHQLSENAFGFDPRSNNYSRKSRIITGRGDTLYQSETRQEFNYKHDISDQQKGIGYIDSLGNLTNNAFDFSKKNFVPLEDLLTTLEMAVRPDLFEQNSTFNFSQEHNEFIHEVMGMLPDELPYPYDSLPDNYVKFLMFGNEENGSIPDNINIFNKVGWAYGYLIDVAYIQDNENYISFFLAAVIHVNENKMYNDGNYEYEQIGLPFLDELGDLIHSYDSNK